MAISIGINGFGRIGTRCTPYRHQFDSETFKLCGINARNAVS